MHRLVPPALSVLPEQPVKAKAARRSAAINARGRMRRGYSCDPTRASMQALDRTRQAGDIPLHRGLDRGPAPMRSARRLSSVILLPCTTKGENHA